MMINEYTIETICRCANYIMFTAVILCVLLFCIDYITTSIVDIIPVKNSISSDFYVVEKGLVFPQKVRLIK